MGNGLSPCVSMPETAPAEARLVYWGGRTKVLPVDDVDEEDSSVGRCGVSTTAGDVVAELLPVGGHVVCPADSFFVGLPIPVTQPEERLLPGRTYFVLPAARFPTSDGKAPVLTAATLASLSAGHKKRVSLAGPGACPFEYIKGGQDGAAPLIRVLPEFIEKVITCDGGNDGAGAGSRSRKSSKCDAAGTASATVLCSTPELRRHYAQLVGARSRPWSPRLETISERSNWRVPARLLLFSIVNYSPEC
uniref:Uncharacterized protein n=1 Tax=Avena sativa TaxID=4498 RepID=A0ACD5XG99_AVESA